MDKNSTYYKELLIKKNNKLREILEYAKSKNFNVNKVEEEVENIELYFRKRQGLFLEVYKIDKNIKALDCKKDLYIEIQNETKKIVNEIITIDKKNKKIFNDMVYKLKGNIKSTKNVGQINKKYFSVYEVGSVGSYFDSSR